MLTAEAQMWMGPISRRDAHLQEFRIHTRGCAARVSVFCSAAQLPVHGPSAKHARLAHVTFLQLTQFNAICQVTKLLSFPRTGCAVSRLLTWIRVAADVVTAAPAAKNRQVSDMRAHAWLPVVDGAGANGTREIAEHLRAFSQMQDLDASKPVEGAAETMALHGAQCWFGVQVPGA